MKLIRTAILALAGVLLLLPPAKADTFTYRLSGATLNGWISLTATNLGGGQYGITNVAGNLTSADFSGAFNVPSYDGVGSNTCCGFQWDNILYPFNSGQIFDSGGVFFQDGSVQVNIWGGGSNNAYLWGDTGSLYGSSPVSVSPTPEPGSLLLLGSGLLGLAIFLFRRARQSLGTMTA